MNNTILHTENLMKFFGKKLVLNNINLSIDRGDIYCIIGENGAGKTTLLELICGTKLLSSGSIKINADRIGIMFGEGGLYLNETAKKNIIYKYKYLNEKFNLKDVENILRLVEIDIENNTFVKNFSMGMKQRLRLAIALVGNPSLIILDEPFRGLDFVSIIRITDLIKSLNKNNKISFIISSHILDELNKIGTKFCFMANGEIIKEFNKTELNLKLEDYRDFKDKTIDLKKLALYILRGENNV